MRLVSPAPKVALTFDRVVFVIVHEYMNIVEHSDYCLYTTKSSENLQFNDMEEKSCQFCINGILHSSY